MNIFKWICLTVYFLLSHLSGHSETHYISIGRDCQIASQLNKFHLRTTAYPMDWMASGNINGVIEAFKDDFKYFLDPAFLEYKTTHILNTYYQFLYNHFFPVIGHPPQEDIWVAGTIVPNYLDYLPAVQTTQGRRIQRLLNVLSSNKEKVIFIRTHSTPDEARAFMEMIKEKYPRLDATLVVVHERLDLIGEWHIPHVLNFYASQKSGFGDWWTPLEWKNIFQHIQNYLKKPVIFKIPKP